MTQATSKSLEGESKSLYEILGVNRDASTAQIKKAFRTLALKVHPDKNPNDKKASENFQQLQRVYEILCDDQKRKIYDETGMITDDEEQSLFSGKTSQELYEYFRKVYKKISKKDIEEYEKSYRFKELEKKDLRDFYEKKKGAISLLIYYIPFSEETDIKRFLEYFDESIAHGEVAQYEEAYEKAKKKLQKDYEKACKNAKKKRKASVEENIDDISALQQQILSRKDTREAAFEAFTDKLLEKYGGDASRKQRKGASKKK